MEIDQNLASTGTQALDEMPPPQTTAPKQNRKVKTKSQNFSQLRQFPAKKPIKCFDGLYQYF
jgi:hypothetical protein